MDRNALLNLSGDTMLILTVVAFVLAISIPLAFARWLWLRRHDARKDMLLHLVSMEEFKRRHPVRVEHVGLLSPPEKERTK